MKKLLLLGGARAQCTAIAEAREMGYYTVLCDYLPDNPGRQIADEWYPASTTDYAAVLEVAKKTKIDGILTYGSDVAASTAAYVAEKLGLPGSPFESVYTLTHKDKFRQFLKENGFRVPWSVSFSLEERSDAVDFVKAQRCPVIVKPVDSQGARGISKVSDAEKAETAIANAFSSSITKRIIVEECLKRKGMQVGGDGFTVDGEIICAPFSNTYFVDEPGIECIPLGEVWPPVTAPETLGRMKDELQRAIRLLGMGTQAYNFELMEDETGEIYILEIGPRNGGNLIPSVTEAMTGFQMGRATLQAAAGDPVDVRTASAIDGFWASRSIGSRESGILERLEPDPDFKTKNLRILEQYVEAGRPVTGMREISNSIAFAAARFDKRDEMMRFVKCPETCISVKLRGR